MSDGDLKRRRVPHGGVVTGSGLDGLFGTGSLRRSEVEAPMIAKTSTELFQPLL